MLGKLLKYELKDRFKFLSVFYILTMVFAVLARVFTDYGNSTFIFVLSAIFRGASFSMMVNIIINNTIRLWALFKSNLFGDESYLTHTLPVKKSTLFLSRYLNGIISLFASFIVILGGVLIMFYTKDLADMIKLLGEQLLATVNIPVWVAISGLVLILYLEFLNTIGCGFAGIILGHKMNNGKIGFSVLFGLITYSVTQVVNLAIIFSSALFNEQIMEMFKSNATPNAKTIVLVLVLATISYLFNCIWVCIFGLKALNKGVNID